MSSAQIDEEITAFEIFVLNEYASNPARKDLEYSIPGCGVIVLHIRRNIQGTAARYTLTDLNDHVLTWSNNRVEAALGVEKRQYNYDLLASFANRGIRAAFASLTRISVKRAATAAKTMKEAA